MCRLSKNLYNYALYQTKIYFEQTRKFLTYNINYHICKTNENYQLLPTQIGQNTMMVVERNFKSYFGLLRERKKGNFNKPINICKYLPKEGFFPCLFIGSYLKINYKNKIILLLSKHNKLNKEFKYGDLNIPLPKHITKDNKIKEIRIIPKNNCKWFEVHYVYEQIELPQKEIKNYLSVDLGVNNLMTCLTNSKSFIIDGKWLKSVNQWFNKIITKEKSQLQKINKKHTSNKIRNLWQKRKNIIKDHFHKISKNLICIQIYRYLFKI